jgi:hypothetical protein
MKYRETCLKRTPLGQPYLFGKDRYHDIAEILLKVALSTIALILLLKLSSYMNFL